MTEPHISRSVQCFDSFIQTAFAKAGWSRFYSMLLHLGISPATKLQGQDLEDFSRKKAHHRNPGFINPWLLTDQPGTLLRFLKWALSPNPYTEAKRDPPNFAVIQPQVEEILTGEDSITYLGHATFWIHLQGVDILTDPIFGDIWSLFPRHVPFPLAPDELPSPQVVLISHNHYDHLDKRSLLRLGSAPLYLTPLGYQGWFSKLIPGVRIIELDWFESFDYRGISFRLLPAQHWTKRTPWDTNRRLWGSWLVQGKDRRIFFSGDSGYFSGFEEFGRKFATFDAALLPIGSYEPRWFMKDHHMNPEEAVKAFQDLRAQVFIPHQWGVFDLTDEPLDLPPRAFREAASSAGFSKERTPLIRHGETWFFPSN